MPPNPAFSLTGGTFATVAKALLGFAGAYLLRAIAESGSVPQSIGIIAGLVYALFWLIWSTRVEPEDRTATTLYGLTATLIFSGLVWENSVEVHTLAFGLGPLLIVLFSYAGLYLAWRSNLPRIAAIAAAVNTSLALVLLVATHDVVPFTAALLAIVAARSSPHAVDRWLGQRWFAALTADLGVFIVAWVITQPQGVPESYHPFGMTSVVTLQMMLVLVFALSLGYRTLITGCDITHFEIGQNTVAIGLFIWGSVVMGREASAARVVVECFCLTAGLGCYATAVRFLARQKPPAQFPDVWPLRIGAGDGRYLDSVLGAGCWSSCGARWLYWRRG